MTDDQDQLPKNIEAERGILGAILIDFNAIHRVTGIVRSEDFYDKRHGWIFSAAKSLSNGGEQTPDFLALCDLLDRRGQLVALGGGAYLTGLVDVMTTIHAETHARMVANYATRRRLIEAAGSIAKAAFDTNTQDPIGEAHRALLTIDNGNNGHLQPLATVAGKLYDQVEYWSHNPLPVGHVRGLSTGIDSLNHLTEGLQSGDLVMIAARPSMGKSALAFEIGARVSEQKKKVVLFSLEMPSEKVMGRLASARSRIETRRVKRGICPEQYQGKAVAAKYLQDDELTTYLHAIGQLSSLPLYIDDTPALSAEDIRARALSMARRVDGLSLVIVDHTGLMRSDPAPGENSAQTEGRKSQRMKQLAKELGCPVLMLQQLNRSVESRGNKRPQLSDLRATGEHEENADIVLGLYWDAYYNKDYPENSAKWLELEVWALKHRDGEAGAMAKLRYERNISRFSEWQI